MTRVVFTILFAFLLCSCDVLFPDVGNLGQPCTAGGACVSGLECVDGRCINPDVADGEHEFSPDGDTNDGDESSDGDTSDGDFPPDGDTDDLPDGDQDVADGDDPTDGDEDPDPDPEEDGDTDTTCVCTTGPCCDGCNYRLSSYVCNDEVTTDFKCAGSSCGDDAQKMTQVRYCSGSSAQCNGSTSWGEWTTHENCGSDEKCDSDNETYSSCSTNASCTSSFSCTNGVCTDPATGFEWQQEPSGGTMMWSSAKTHCQNLDLNGTGWRLPNISELRSLIRNCSDIETGGACGVQDECSACGVSSGDVCLRYDSCWSDSSCNPDFCSSDGGPTGCYWPPEFSGTCNWYWSSSPVEDNDNLAWDVYFDYGDVHYDGVSNGYGGVRCVR